MYLKSKNQLNYNSGVTGQTSSIVIGVVKNFSRSGDCNWFGANFIYANFETEGDEKEVIQEGSFELKSGAEIQAMFDAIKNKLPDIDIVGEPAHESAKIAEAFRLKMVETFLPLNPSLTVEDIEIIY